jgi:hypothetical protein
MHDKLPSRAGGISGGTKGGISGSTKRLSERVIAGIANLRRLFPLAQIGGAILLFGQTLPGLSHRYEASTLANWKLIG